MQTSRDDAEQRSATRASLYLAASLYHDGYARSVRIRNLSSTGALLESGASLSPGALVQLVRGSLIVHGLVAWAAEERCGLKFSGSIDVQQWRAGPANAEQQRIDDVVRLIKAGAVPLPTNVPTCDQAPSMEELSADLERAVALLGRLEDRLANDGIVVAQYPAELQNLDIATQVIAAVASALGGGSAWASGSAKFINLRKSADQALKAAAA